MERLVLLGKRPEIAAEELPVTVREAEPPRGMSFGEGVMPIRELQRRYAAWALQQCGGHRGRTAERLGIDPKTLSKWLEEPEDAGADPHPGG